VAEHLDPAQALKVVNVALLVWPEHVWVIAHGSLIPGGLLLVRAILLRAAHDNRYAGKVRTERQILEPLAEIAVQRNG
jgi:hypothetical protein